jgi:Tannase-like family of unknown function (DUF6351)
MAETTMTKRIAFILLAAFLFSSFVLAHAQAPVEEISGTFVDGTRWSVRKPANWNGTLLLDLDGAGTGSRPPAMGANSTVTPRPPMPPPGVGGPNVFNNWLLAQGYSLGGTTREPVGYDFPKAAAYLVEVRNRFIEKWGEPKRTLASGGSRGAFVVRMSLELYPSIYDGGMMSAGGGAGEIAVLNNKLNSLFILKTLVDPAAPLTLVNIDVQAENRALSELVAKANSTPRGRARLAFAAAAQQFALWSSRGKPKPAPTDYDTQLDQIAENFAFATAVPVRGGVEKIAGGNVSWNTGVDYEDLLKHSGRKAMVEALYVKAGLDLKADLATLANTPRIKADPGAVRRAEPMMTYTGRIQDPLVNVDNDDPVDPAADKLAYLQTLKHAGTDKFLRLLWSDRPGHGGQTNLDRAVGFTLLIQRVETGKWGDTSLPALKKMAADISQRSPELGELGLFDPGPISKPLDTWDVSNWGSYQWK